MSDCRSVYFRPANDCNFNQVVDEQYQQYDLFTDPAELEREHRMQEAILDIKEKFGKRYLERDGPAGRSHYDGTEPSDRRA